MSIELNFDKAHKITLYSVASALIFLPLCYILLCSEINYRFEFQYATNGRGETMGLVISLLVYAILYYLIHLHIYACCFLVLLFVEMIFDSKKRRYSRNYLSPEFEMVHNFALIALTIVSFVLFFLHITNVITIKFY